MLCTRSEHVACALDTCCNTAVTRAAMNHVESEVGDHVILLACGTRGDVHPLALLADRLHAESTQLRIDLVTHAAHEEWLRVHSGVQCHWLPQPPARIWANADGAAKRNAGIRTALLECCTAMCHAHSSACRRCILCNLFSLEGFHLAEKLGCSCVVVSPCIVPYAPPASFERRFKAAFPQLYHRLQDSSAGEVGWGEVEHWMWPLFTESWQLWRQEALDLEPVPFLSAVQDGHVLPPAPPLLYGLGESIVAPPGFWPKSVHMCGFWLDSQAGDDLSTFLGNDMADTMTARSTVAIDLGSMPRMGFLPDATGFVEALCGALVAAKLRGLILTGSYQPLADACHAVAKSNTADLVLASVADVPHTVLLPHCCAIVHHGGAGTTAASLAAGCPQLVCPMHFDQFTWAERVEDLGAGMQLPAARQLLAGTGSEEGRMALRDGLAAGLQRCVQPSCRSQYLRIAAELRQQPDGLHVAAQQILQQLASSKACKATALSLPALLPRAPALGANRHVQLDSFTRQRSDATAQLPENVQLCELAPAISVRTSCPEEAYFIFHEVFTQQCYLQHGVTINAGDTVIDCGANIGLFTLQLLLSSPAPAVLLAVEPLPQNLALLRQNLALHAVAGSGSGCDVRVLPLAVGGTGGSRMFTYFPHMPGNSTARPGEKAQLQAAHMPAARFADQQTCSCPIVTISDLICQEQLQRVDLLKVDVEGMELAVLQGIAAHHWPLIRQLVAEVHDVIEDGSSRLTDVLSLLRSQGFECRVVPAVPKYNVLVYAMRQTA